MFESFFSGTFFKNTSEPVNISFTDAVAYAALLRNELLGAGIETVPDPHTDERRHTVLTQDTHSLFRVSPVNITTRMNIL